MPSAWTFRDFRFDPQAPGLQQAGRSLELGARALGVLRVLLEAGGRLVAKQALLEAAWPGLVVEENNLQVQVSALRKALGGEAIITEAGRGYRFAWPAERVDGDAGALAPCAPPASLHPLVGRDADLREVLSACAEARLATLTGPAGIGKTRLALAAAADWAGGGPVAWCELAMLFEGSLVGAAMVRALGLEPGEGDALEAALPALRGQRFLLVIDNAEHLRAAVAAAVARLLSAVPGGRVLCTSQVPLDLPGEQVLRIGPLALPRGGADLQQAAASDAVALFIGFARAADRRFVLDEASLPAVLDLCRRLDGHPLALQLAAARLPQFGASGLAQRLDERLRLLARTAGAVPERQRTLAAALDWSHGLLGTDEQRLLRRLSVLPGPFTASEAHAACAAPGESAPAFDAQLARLLAHSLVENQGGDPPVLRLLETVRLYGREQLVAHGDWDALGRGIEHLAQRAREAAARSAPAEAAAAGSAALELVAQLPPGAARDARELPLLLALGPAVQSLSSPGSPRCEALYARAVSLARPSGDAAALFKALWGHWQFLLMAGREREAAGVAAELGTLGATLPDDGLQLEACHVRFSTAQLLGDAREVLEHAEAAIRMYVPGRHAALADDFGGHDPWVCALGQSAVALWLLGRTPEAYARAGEAERAGEGLSHAYSQAVGFYYAAMTYAAAAAREPLARAAARLAGVSSSHGMAVLQVEARLFAARAAWQAGGPRPANDAAIGEYAAAYDEIVAAADYGFVPYYAALLADMLLSADDAQGALARITVALRISEAGQGFFVPELHRLRARALQRLGDPAGARAARAAGRALALAQGCVALGERLGQDEATAADAVP